MCADILLGCSAGLEDDVAVRLLEPAGSEAPTAGELLDPPAAWTNETRLFGDVKQLSDWVRDSAGTSLLDAVGSIITTDDVPSRLLIYAAPSALAKSHALPWELLEHWGVEHRYHVGENLSVVRLATQDTDERPPSAIGERLRILVTWANPDDDISDLHEHLAELEDFRAKNDFRVEMNIVEFRSRSHVLGETSDFHPDVVYHVSHGSQPAPKGKLTLRLGPRGAAVDTELGSFVEVLKAIGSPRLIVLNACESFRGQDLNAYLAAALDSTPHFDAVVAMQTKVPIPAAMRFAGHFLTRLSNGAGLARSMHDARREMARGRYIKAEQLPALTRFVPVLFQRTRNDKLFSVDLSARDHSRVLDKLNFQLVKIDPYLPRDADVRITELLAGRTNRSVSVVRGPKWTGKSTSVGEVMRSLNKSARGERHLYYAAIPRELTGSLHEQVRQVLRGFAATFGWMTYELREALTGDEPANPSEALESLAGWLRDQQRAGLRFAIALDSLPSALASHMAELASRLIDHGHLMLVCRDAEIEEKWPIEVVGIDRMNAAELQRALPDKSPEYVDDLIVKSNGMPLFIVAARQLRFDAKHAAEFVAGETVSLDDTAMDILTACALSREPIPRDVLEQWGPGVVQSIPAPLVLKTGANAYLVPEQFRDAIAGHLDSEQNITLRNEVLLAFNDRAAEERSSGFDRQRIIAYEKEAFRQALELLALLGDDARAPSVLDSAKEIMKRLSYELLERDHQPETAKTLWEKYLAASMRAGIERDREAESRYALSLARAGLSEDADAHLEFVTSDGNVDATQVQSLLVRSEIAKDLGLDDTWKRRIGYLELARSAAERLPGETKRGLANIEFELGNALGYGEQADWQRAIAHLENAANIYDELGDILVYRARTEIIEVKRYNGQLDGGERAEAIAVVRERADELAMMGERYDAILHLYELGRLEESPAAKAEWFRRAFERAGTAYAPLNWHAAIRWRMNEIDADPYRFPELKDELLRYCAELSRWQNRAWSRRVLRDALRFLAARFGGEGDAEQQRDALRRCWEVVRHIRNIREGRRDRSERIAIAQEVAAARGDVLNDELLQSSLNEVGGAR